MTAAHCAPPEVKQGIHKVVAVLGAHNISNPKVRKG